MPEDKDSFESRGDRMKTQERKITEGWIEWPSSSIFKRLREAVNLGFVLCNSKVKKFCAKVSDCGMCDSLSEKKRAEACKRCRKIKVFVRIEEDEGN